MEAGIIIGECHRKNGLKISVIREENLGSLCSLRKVLIWSERWFLLLSGRWIEAARD